MSTHQQSSALGIEQRRVHESALEQAVTAALRAPSIFNTQPWQWRVRGGVAELRADRDRQLRVVDPEGRLLTLSCGVALHHLRTALAATGHLADAELLPDAADPNLLARVRICATREPERADAERYEALLARHTDRRPFQPTPIPAATLSALRGAAEAHGAHLHVVRPDQVTALIVAADQAAAAEIADPEYRAELATWTHRSVEAGDGVPASTAVPEVHWRAPVRDFAVVDGTPGLDPGTGDDTGTTYAILFTGDDHPRAWLLAGEALSALLLTAVERGAAVSPMSDLVEVTATRETLRGILAGIGHPLLVLRIGIAEPAGEALATPRRDPREVIEREGTDDAPERAGS